MKRIIRRHQEDNLDGVSIAQILIAMDNITLVLNGKRRLTWWEHLLNINPYVWVWAAILAGAVTVLLKA